MKKKELKKLTAEQANLVRDMSVLMMRQNPTNICYQRNLEPSNQLSELLKDASDKAENENSDLQMVYSQIISLKAALMNERRKRKKLEKRVQGMDSKWSKNWEKVEKKLSYMEQIITLITTYTGKIKGDTLPAVLKSLKKNLYEGKRGIIQ